MVSIAAPTISWSARFGAVVLGPRRARNLLASHVLGVAGTSFVSVAMAGTLFFGVDFDASRRRIAAYVLVSLLPALLLMPVIGPAVDRARWGGGKIAMLGNSMRAACALTLALTWTTPLFLVGCFGILVANKTWSAGKYALLPELVRDGVHLLDANVRFAKWGGIAGAIASIAAVVTMHRLGITTALLIAAALFSAATGCLSPVLMSHQRTHRDPAVAAPLPPRARIAAVQFAGVRGSVALFTFGAGFALRSENARLTAYAALGAAYALGVFGGNVASPIVRRLTAEENMIRTAGGGAGLAALVAFGADGTVTRTAAAFALGVAAAVSRQAFDATLQSESDPSGRGRNYAAFETILQTAWAASALTAVLVVPAWSMIWGAIGAALIAGTVASTLTRDTTRSARRPVAIPVSVVADPQRSQLLGSVGSRAGLPLNGPERGFAATRRVPRVAVPRSNTVTGHDG